MGSCVTVTLGVAKPLPLPPPPPPADEGEAAPVGEAGEEASYDGGDGKAEDVEVDTAKGSPTPPEIVVGQDPIGAVSVVLIAKAVVALALLQHQLTDRPVSLFTKAGHPSRPIPKRGNILSLFIDDRSHVLELALSQVGCLGSRKPGSQLHKTSAGLPKVIMKQIN